MTSENSNLDSRLAQLVSIAELQIAGINQLRDAVAQTNQGIESLTKSSCEQKESIQQLAGVVIAIARSISDLSSIARGALESSQAAQAV